MTPEAKRAKRIRWAALQRRDPYHFLGVDLRELLRSFAALPAFEGMLDRRSLPELHVRYSAYGQRSTGGHHRIRLSIAYHSDFPNVAETLLHELTHAACTRSSAHGELFRMKLAAAARQAWGAPFDRQKAVSIEKGPHTCRAYALDGAIVAWLRLTWEPLAPWLEPLGRVEEPAPPKVDRVAAMQAGRAKAALKREARARAALDKAERRLAAAKKIQRKWRTRVSYYDRVAAKKAGS